MAKQKKHQIINVFAAISISLVTLLNLHEIFKRTGWIDEYQAWTIASRAENVNQLLIASYIDGRPPLFFLLLRGINWAGGDFDSINYLLSLLIVLSSILLYKIASLNFISKILINFSYFYQIVMISKRDYALIWFFVIIAIFSLERMNQQRKIYTRIFFASIYLSILTNFFGLVIGFILLAFYVRNRIEKHNMRFGLKMNKLSLSSVITIFVFGISFGFMQPLNRDNLFMIKKQSSFEDTIILIRDAFSIALIGGNGRFGNLATLIVVALSLYFSYKISILWPTTVAWVSIFVLFQNGFANGTHQWHRSMMLLILFLPFVLDQVDHKLNHCEVKLKSLSTSMIVIILLSQNVILFKEHIECQFCQINLQYNEEKEVSSFLDKNVSKDEVIVFAGDGYSDWIALELTAYSPRHDVYSATTLAKNPWIVWSETRTKLIEEYESNRREGIKLSLQKLKPNVIVLNKATKELVPNSFYIIFETSNYVVKRVAW